METKKSKSRLDYFKSEIEDLILNKGVSIKSAWKIINSNIPEFAKISYQGFHYYVRKNIKNMTEK